MFYRARYYDPVLKRFISEDPLGLTAGLNGYRYVDNAPTMATDPDGELPIVPLAIAYARCVAGCMAQAAAGEALFGDIECFDVGDNAKDCALDCLNPFNWGGKAGLGIGKGKPKITKHTQNRHVDRSKYPDKSKFKDPSQLDKNTDRTINKPDRTIDQGDRVRHERDFGRDVGTKGEQTVVVVIDKTTGKVITTFPK